MDSLPSFPRNAVHQGTEAFLISVFEKGTDEPSPYGRPEDYFLAPFIKVTIGFSQLFKYRANPFSFHVPRQFF